MTQIRTVLIAFLFLASIAAASHAGVVYDVVPSSATGNVNGIQFSPLGGDLVVTNTLTLAGDGTATPLYLDFGAGYGHADAAGNVFYLPKNDTYQLYVLTRTLLAPPSSVLAEAIFLGESEARNLGGGRYEFTANLMGRVGPAFSDLDTPATIVLTFDTSLPLGHQVEGGRLTFSTVPEPPSLALAFAGAALVVSYFRFARNPL